METGARIYFEAFDETAARDAAFSSLGQSWVDYGELTDGMYPDDPNEDPGQPHPAAVCHRGTGRGEAG